MSAQLDELAARVAKNNDVTQSAVALLRGIKEQLDAAGVDAPKLAALSASLGTQTDQLAAAVSENTPAAQPPPPEPTS